MTNPHLGPTATRTQLAARARESARWYAEAGKTTPAFLPLVAVFEREAAHQEEMAELEEAIKEEK